MGLTSGKLASRSAAAATAGSNPNDRSASTFLWKASPAFKLGVGVQIDIGNLVQQLTQVLRWMLKQARCAIPNVQGGAYPEAIPDRQARK